VPIILVGGGSRSGKSRYALELARQHGSRRGFLATAQALDQEMQERILQHQRDRGDEFLTIEEPLDIGGAIGGCHLSLDVLVIDCLTVWLSNLVLAGREPDIDDLLDAAGRSPLTCILVTNEVGCGIVPDNALARRFRDLAGTLHQRIAARADQVYWMIFGIPFRVK